MTLRALAALLLIAGSAACDRRPDKGPVVASIIGGSPRLPDPARRRMSEPDRVLAAATAQGLVSFDATGSCEPRPSILMRFEATPCATR